MYVGSSKPPNPPNPLKENLNYDFRLLIALYLVIRVSRPTLHRVLVLCSADVEAEQLRWHP